MNINAVLETNIGDLLELRKILKTPEAKIWIDGAFNELSRLSQGSKKKTIKYTNTIHIISPNQKPTNKKQPILELSSATDHKKNTLIDFESLLEVTKITIQMRPLLQILTLPHPNASSTVLSAQIPRPGHQLLLPLHQYG